MYTSLIVDMENSRKYDLKKRNLVQNHVIEIVEQLNSIFRESLKFEVTFSGGDELQGLFEDTTVAVLYLRLLSILVMPLRIRAGIGVGEWNVKIRDGLSTQQDGPVYHRAREAIMDVKKKQLHSYRINSGDNDDFANSLLNASVQLQIEQAQKQNLTLTIMELLYPFQKNLELKFTQKMIWNLLNEKIKYNSKMENTTAQSGKETMNLKNNSCFVEAIPIDGVNFDAEKAIEKKNMSTNIAAILGSKRQNADKLIKRGHILLIRSLDYTALQFIERTYSQHD